MRQRPTTSGRTPHTRRRKTVARKANKKPKTAGDRPSSAQGRNAGQLARERDETSEQLSAASEVLRVISSSPAKLEPVFETMLASATRICQAKFGALFLSERDGLRAVALHNAPPPFAQAMSSIFDPPPFTAIGPISQLRSANHGAGTLPCVSRANV